MPPRRPGAPPPLLLLVLVVLVLLVVRPAGADSAVLTATWPTPLAAPPADASHGDPEAPEPPCAAAGAGDLNGDAYADLLLLCPDAARLLFGGPAPLLPRSLAARDAFALRSPAASVGAAAAVRLGDVSGDGLDDVALVWAHGGPVALLLGCRGAGDPCWPPAGLDVASLDALGRGTANVAVAGPLGALANATSGVAGVGDIDGDRIGDVAVGLTSDDAGGAALVVWGRATWRSAELAASASPQSWVLLGRPSASASASPTRVSGAGDVNSDGAADLVMSGAASAVVVFGQYARGALALPNASSTADVAHGLRVAGAAVGCASPGGLGDFDGDGVDDVALLLVAEGSRVAVAVVAGRKAWRSVDVGAGDARALLSAQAPSSGSCVALSPAGDLDGDRRADVVVAVTSGCCTPSSELRCGVYVAYGRSLAADSGSSTSAADVTLYVASPGADVLSASYVGLFLNSSGGVGDKYVATSLRSTGVTLVTRVAAGRAAWSPSGNVTADLAADGTARAVSTAVRYAVGADVVAVGDFNGDAVDDVLVPMSAGPSLFRASFLGRRLRYTRWAAFGAVGDVNGDRLADVAAVGADAVFLLLGARSPAWPSPVDLPLAASSTLLASGFVAAGVDGVGDVSGDGVDDFAVVDAAGGVRVVLGRAEWPARVDLGAAGAAARLTPPEPCSGARASRAGDFDGDGVADMLVVLALATSPASTRTYVVYGYGAAGAAWPASSALASQPSTELTTAAAVASASGGRDVNADGADDVVLGLAGAPSQGQPQAGVVLVVQGARGRRPSTLCLRGSSECPGDAWRALSLLGESAFDAAGARVALCGDSNGDGVPDVAVAAPEAGGAAGKLYVVFGSAGLYWNDERRRLLAAADGRWAYAVFGAARSLRLGAALACADVDGDGLADVVAAAGGALATVRGTAPPVRTLQVPERCLRASAGVPYACNLSQALRAGPGWFVVQGSGAGWLTWLYGARSAVGTPPAEAALLGADRVDVVARGWPSPASVNWSFALRFGPAVAVEMPAACDRNFSAGAADVALPPVRFWTPCANGTARAAVALVGANTSSLACAACSGDGRRRLEVAGTPDDVTRALSSLRWALGAARGDAFTLVVDATDGCGANATASMRLRGQRLPAPPGHVSSDGGSGSGSGDVVANETGGDDGEAARKAAAIGGATAGGGTVVVVVVVFGVVVCVRRRKAAAAAREALLENVVPVECIGAGAFGQVWRGVWDGVTPVAMKRIDAGGDGAGREGEQQRQLIAEAATLRELRHPNIVSCYGVARAEGRLWMVTELAEGSVLALLHAHPDCPPAPCALARMAASCAAGMNYLASRGVVHRDLAARNLLYARTGRGQSTVKVADFGLARTLSAAGAGDVDGDDGAEEARGGGGGGAQGAGEAALSALTPVRWSAPESLARGEYTAASDVWSFGVVLWELYSNGAKPYEGLANADVLAALAAGRRLEPPPGMPAALAALMRECFREDPALRPTFACICARLGAFIAGSCRAAEGEGAGDTTTASECDDDERTTGASGSPLSPLSTDYYSYPAIPMPFSDGVASSGYSSSLSSSSSSVRGGPGLAGLAGAQQRRAGASASYSASAYSAVIKTD
eukprot:m51a1_g7851 putative ephrin type-b receptor 1 isoform x2 (1609) ;mRNA; f:228914-233740